MHRAVRFQSASPDAMASAQVLMPHVAILRGSPLEHLISEYGLESIDPSAVYAQQLVCDIQHAMHDTGGMFNGDLVAVGRESLKSIVFPEGVSTIQQALGMMNQLYHKHHQNVPEEEGWGYEELADGRLKIRFNSPYEPYLAYGRAYFVANRFKGAGCEVVVELSEEDGITVFMVEICAAEPAPKGDPFTLGRGS